jgi:hypothetical protein
VKEALTTLCELGVTKHDLRRIVSDQTHAALVAAVLGGAHVETTPTSLKQLVVRATLCGALSWVNGDITSKHFPQAGMRGKLKLINGKFGKRFTTEQALCAIRARGYRPATVYEGLVYATTGWDRRTTVGLFGSFWEHPEKGRQVCCLDPNSMGRFLGMYKADSGTWGRHARLLVVCR